MEAQLISKLTLTNFPRLQEELAFLDDLVIDISPIFNRIMPKSDIRNFSPIQINLLQNGNPVMSPTDVRDSDYGNDFSLGSVFAVIPNEVLDQLPRGYYQVMLQLTVGQLTRSFNLPVSVRLKTTTTSSN